MLQGSREYFDESELNRLINNLNVVATAYKMRFPYLLAGIQTGLETRRHLFDFNDLQSKHQIYAKLCNGLDNRYGTFPWTEYFCEID